MKQKILIVDDEKIIRDMMARILSASYDCRTASDGDQALAALEAEPDLSAVVTDYKMPGMNGIDLIRAVRARPNAPACILLTAFGEIALAVEAMKAGASDFLTKPITDLDLLEQKIAGAIEADAPQAAAAATGDQPARGKAAGVPSEADDPIKPFTGRSPAMQRVYRLIRKVAPANATVLVEGPSGSGKELVARAVHQLSPRAKKPFVALECSAFPGDLLASELFGYMPGTFTGGLAAGKAGCFEAADGGTIFLDEIGEIDRTTQVALLRVLESKSVRRLGGAEEKKVDFRLVAATNRDLAAMVANGSFREDLYYRLNVIDIRMPPLKDRPGDVRLLAEHFLKEFSAANGGRVTGFAPDALAALERFPWPGNVRQLRNTVEKMIVLATGDTLTAADLPDDIVGAAVTLERDPPRGRISPKCASPVGAAVTLERDPPRGRISPKCASPVDAKSVRVPVDAESLPRPPSSLADAEKEQILATLRETRGNKSKAAEILGISRRTLHRKLNEWNMQ